MFRRLCYVQLLNSDARVGLAMIGVKQAVGSAIDYVREFSDFLPTQDIRLEETELVEKEGNPVWLVTLSFVESRVIGSRAYKIFEIDADNGMVNSMKVRNILVPR
jgi:hypothetical protein